MDLQHLWFGRVWQLRALRNYQYSQLMASKRSSHPTSDVKKIESKCADVETNKLIIKLQGRWRGAVTRKRACLSVLEVLKELEIPIKGVVVYMHGSGGMTVNNMRCA